MRRPPLGSWGIVALALFSACSLKTMAVRTTAEILNDGVATFESEPDVALAREAAASQIKLLESLHRADPENREILLGLTRVFGSYAFGFLDFEAESDPAVRARAAALYDRGATYGLRLLDLTLGAGTSRLAHEGSLEDWSKHLAKASAKDLPSLFWTAYDWAGAIRKRVNSATSLIELPKAIALVERVVALDADYYYGSPHLMLGVYFADRPKMAGGNPQQANKHFRAAMDLAQNRFIMGKYLYARYYAVQVQDRRLFERLLGEVVAAPDDLLPEQRLSQEIAKDWARKALKRKQTYFAEE